VKAAAAALGLLLIATGSASCLKTVEKLPAVQAKQNLLTATPQQLRELIDAKYAAVTSLKYARMRVQFEGLHPDKGVKESYPRGSGYVVLQRPAWILMNITNPLTSSTVAAMAADGRRFQLFVPRENKYITGSVEVEVEAAEPLYNIRPQHVAEAILVEPLGALPERRVFVHEDSDLQSAYYVVAELQDGPASTRLRRRLWIERSRLRLMLQQWYGDGGQLVSDAVYGAEIVVGGLPVFSEVVLTRPADRYLLRFSFAAEAVKVNEMIEEESFKVAQPPGAEAIEVKDKVKL
jgi:hypothetical protein